MKMNYVKIFVELKIHTLFTYFGPADGQVKTERVIMN